MTEADIYGEESQLLTAYLDKEAMLLI
jgi:hypothetical protein